jgi:CDGSH-type Zn-finger protein
MKELRNPHSIEGKVEHMTQEQDMKITITKDGPYLVEGSVPLTSQTMVSDGSGGSKDWIKGDAIEGGSSYKLCRCGQSMNKPFCDGSHLSNGFDGNETASRALYAEQSGAVHGAHLTLTDAEKYCASARFCHPGGGTWKLARSSDEADVQHAIREAGNCPSGRLVARDVTTGVAIEPKFAPSIGLIEDPDAGVSGPIWVRGGIPIVGANGETYEIRNRVTLCRCGGSSNKPFCDGTHLDIGFQA